MLVIRAEEHRLLFGFWRRQRLHEIDERLKPGGKSEIATIALREGDEIRKTRVRQLTQATVEAQHDPWQPTAI